MNFEGAVNRMAPMIKGNLYWHWPQIMRTDGDRNVLLIKATNNGKNDLLSGIVVASSVFTLAHNYGLSSHSAQNFRSFF